MAFFKNRLPRSANHSPALVPAATVVAAALLLSAPSLAQTQMADASPNTLKKMSLEELMELDITSVSKQAEPFGQAAAAIQVVTGDEIRLSGASSIPEALRLAGNLDVAQQNSHDWSISARGFNAGLANKLLVLVDGRSVYTPLYSGVFWYAQDALLGDLDRIEVVAGPGGTLWGANAVNGVINVMTKEAKDTQGFHLEGGAGNRLSDFGGLRYGGELDPKTHFRVYGKYFDRGNESYNSGADTSDAWRFGQGGFRLDTGDAGSEMLTLQGDVYGALLNIPAPYRTTHVGGNVLGRWSKAFSEGDGLSLQAYYDRTEFTAPGGGSSNFTDNLDTVDLDFQQNFPLTEGNRLVWGLGYRFTHDVTAATASLAFPPPVLDHHLFSCFLQDEITLVKEITLALGTKLENNDYTGFEWEPAVRVKLLPDEGQMVWMAVSRAVRMPSRIDRDFFAYQGAATLLAGGPGFKSEKMVSCELGYRGRLAQQATLSLSTFYNFYDDLRSIIPTPGTTFPYIFANSVDGETWGGELSFELEPAAGWQFTAGWNLIKEKMNVKAGQVDTSNGLGNTSDPENQLFLRSLADVPGGFQLGMGLRWVDVRPIVSGTTVGAVLDYLEMDARLGWRPAEGVEISCTGTNLLHDHHPEYGFPNAARTEVKRGLYGEIACSL